MRLVVRWSMGLVALAAAALSYQSLMHLGELAGYGWLSPLFPMVVDAGAAASCAAWIYTRGRQPLVMTWALLLTSVVLNGTTHYLEATRTAPSWLLVVAVAAVPPTVLGLTIHLAVDMRRPGQECDLELAGPTAPETPGNGGELTRTPAIEPQTESCRLGRPHESKESVEPTACGVRAGDNQVNAENQGANPISQLIEAGAGRRKIAAQLDISEHAARKLLAARRNGDMS